jgi:nitrogenase molybdenum-iron protein alpha/beta subunit
MGGTVQAVLTHHTALEDVQKIPRCEGSLVLSHDAGQRAASLLNRQYGIEPWCQDLPLPIGFTNTRNWLAELGRRLGAEKEAQRIISQGEKLVVETCRRRWLEQAGMHRAPAAVVADATLGIPLLRFITEDLEMIPSLVCLRSGQAGAREMLERELADLALEPKIEVNVDVYRAKMALAEARPEIVLGSNIERHAAEELGIPFILQVANPIARFRMLDRAYFGYTGMLNLIEAMQNDWMDRYRSRQRRYKARW